MIQPLEPAIRAIAEGAAAKLSGAVELVRGYGRPVAVRSQCEWLGWPESVARSRVELDWIAANRDPRVFGDAAANLVYGTGPHVCPGRLISTIEIRCGITALLRATDSFSLDPDSPSEREKRPAGGWRTVHLVLG